MDFIRASVKALFYDYPVDTAIQIVTTGSPSLTGVFTQVVNARERCYSNASMGTLYTKLRNEWMEGAVLTDGIDEMLKSFRLPWLYASEVLDGQLEEPTVIFRQLFRWNELTRYVGEDLLTVNYLAKRDADTSFYRRCYTWDSVLPHNNDDLYTALRSGGRGWCDIHQHLGATTDIFGMNWISVMNHIRGKKEAFAKLKRPLDSPVVVTKSYNFDDLYRWCVLAAMIRWELFRRYVKDEQEAFNEHFEDEFARIARQVPMYFRYELRDLQCRIDDAGKESVKTSDDKAFDYAITPKSVDVQYLQSPFMIYHGERYLLYQYYHDYWTNHPDSRVIGKYVFLYELIKNQLRCELLQVNDLPGLGNFQSYDHRMNDFTQNGLGRTAKRYAVQTTMVGTLDGMEARISPQGDRKGYKYVLNLEYQKHLFGKGEFTTVEDLHDRMTFVVHFLKAPCEINNRFAELRERHRWQAELLMEKVYAKGHSHRIVGIDVAGGETYCRPEVFAHLYRYCRRMGMKNFTYHVGEDFYDITDGLRSIDEAIGFLQLEAGNRLGHCTALGMDAKRYYSQRHRMVIMPRQLLLDNLVWLIDFAQRHRVGLLGLHDKLQDTILRLYTEIGYKEPFDMATYRRSMLLRGNDFEKYAVKNSTWLSTAVDDSYAAQEARKDAAAFRLCREYFWDKNVFANGIQKTAEFKMPFLYDRVIKKVQNRMMQQINDKKICIETNPTSNVRIGQLSLYEQLPGFRFTKMRKRPSQDIMVSVNTDDKGIFATSLHREYALLALALDKQRMKGDVRRWSEQMIYEYVGQLADAGQAQRFR